MAMEWKDFYKAAKKNVKPTYKQLRKMDADDWLASIGLEKRNVTADIFGALGLVCLGCGIGFALGLFYAPKKGDEFRKDFGEKIKGATGRMGIGAEQGQGVRAPNTPGGYAS